MDLFNTKYFRINKRVLIAYGLWPYQSQLIRRINYLMFVMTTFSMIYAMVAGIHSQSKVEFVNILETVVALSVCCAGIVICTILYNQRNQIKTLYEQIAADWEKLTDTSERNILQTFSMEGRNLILFTIVYAIPAFAIFICVEFFPRIFSSQESAKNRRHSFPYYSESMIISENSYDLQVCVHLFVVVIYVGFAFLSASATYISSVKHVCALYAIACLRLQNAIPHHKNNKQCEKLIEDTSVIPSLIKVIEMHEEALSKIPIIEQTFSAGFFVFETSAMTTTAILMFDLNNCDTFFERIRVLTILSVFVLYVFFMNWCGEQIIQSCNDVHITAYNINWYKISIKARIFIFMIMRRTLKPVHLTAGTLMILSMENFAMILKTAWSFGTILLTTQKSARNKDANIFEY